MQMFKIGGKLSQFDWPSETEAIRSFIILVDTNILKKASNYKSSAKKKVVTTEVVNTVNL